MDCPFCNTQMEPGNLTVRGTGCGLLLFGLSYQHCWFDPEEGQAELFVSNKIGRMATHPSCGSYREASRCPECYTVVAPGDDEMIERAVQAAAADAAKPRR